MILNTGKTLPKNSRNLSNQSNVLPVFNITEQTVLVQAVYVKRVSWGPLYVSYTLDVVGYAQFLLMTFKNA